MTETSLDIYFRSLIAEAQGLKAQSIRVSSDGARTKLEMNIDGQWMPYPHPPRHQFGNLLDYLREKAPSPREVRVERRGHSTEVRIDPTAERDSFLIYLASD